MAAEVFMVNTALTFSVKPASAPIDAVENVSAQPRMEGPTKSNIAAVTAEYESTTALRISMVVPTFYRRTRLAHEILDKLKVRFPKEIAHTVVGYHVKIDEAQSRGLSIFEYAPKDRAASVMAELAEELELRGEPGYAGSPA